jgi:alkyl hydroperoxide reductase subunit AhpC
MALTIRSVFIIDPKKTIRLIQAYPASTGRNTAELLRVVDSLQAADKHRINTPANWNVGDEFVIPASVADKEAQTIYSDIRTVKPYLRYAGLTKEATLPTHK